jgi:hypothetical protein
VVVDGIDVGEETEGTTGSGGTGDGIGAEGFVNELWESNEESKES